MIPTESRMREIRTSGSTSGGVETDRMGAGLSTKRKRRIRRTGPYPAPRHPPTLLMSCVVYIQRVGERCAARNVATTIV